MPNTLLDMIDLRILEAVQANGRITNQELADQVGLSPAHACAGCGSLRRRGSLPAMSRL